LCRVNDQIVQVDFSHLGKDVHSALLVPILLEVVPGLEVEDRSKLLVWDLAGLKRRRGVLDVFSEQLLFVSENLGYSLFDCPLDDKTYHLQWLLTTEPVSSMNGLILYGWVPPPVEDDHRRGFLEIQTHATCS